MGAELAVKNTTVEISERGAMVKPSWTVRTKPGDRMMEAETVGGDPDGAKEEMRQRQSSRDVWPRWSQSAGGLMGPRTEVEPEGRQSQTERRGGWTKHS